MEANSGGGGGAGSSSNSSDFVRKLYKMLENPTDENVVRWGNEGDSFVVLENEKFTKHILPKHFKHSNFASFVRQLNKYDFHKVRHNNEDNGQSPYGPGAWEFKHPDFKMNNKDALDNIRRKAPAARKPNPSAEEALVPTQQIDMLNSQLVATQQQLQHMQEKNAELSVQNSLMIQELICLQKTIVNHEQILHNVVTFLSELDAQRRRDSRGVSGFPPAAAAAAVAAAAAAASASDGSIDSSNQHQQHPLGPGDDDAPPSPLQHASKLLSETNVDGLLNNKALEQISEMSMRMTGVLTTPSPDYPNQRNGGGRPSSGSAPHSAASPGHMRWSELDSLVYPVGQTNGIDPMYSEHIHNIPYQMPVKPADASEARAQSSSNSNNNNNAPSNSSKKGTMDPGWIRPPAILLVEDDVMCRRIGMKFLDAFNCQVTTALDGLEAVQKMNGGAKFDLILMDIIMPNLDGVSACHLIRQFDPTPIIAMTSNIKSDDIAMYYHHGMNDVLPKPFTKEGLLLMLEKHLATVKKSSPVMDSMVSSVQSIQSQHPVQPVQSGLGHGAPRQPMKEEESPGKSPAGTSAWNSPNQIPGVSPVGSTHTDEYMNVVGGHGTMYAVPNPMAAGGMAFQQQPQQMMQPPLQGHRRAISEVSGTEDLQNNAKRQQMYASAMSAPTMASLQRPR